MVDTYTFFCVPTGERFSVVHFNLTLLCWILRNTPSNRATFRGNDSGTAELLLGHVNMPQV